MMNNKIDFSKESRLRTRKDNNRISLVIIVVSLVIAFIGFVIHSWWYLIGYIIISISLIATAYGILIYKKKSIYCACGNKWSQRQFAFKETLSRVSPASKKVQFTNGYHRRIHGEKIDYTHIYDLHTNCEVCGNQEVIKIKESGGALISYNDETIIDNRRPRRHD